ncbi:sulfite exporter TauE/SafE family protein [Nakamurella sp.]|uniref:sulfite exporter TauE/SafE family protein n=1 Tax=Nakamurella sp. TaxID=1869182 RepID=UPI003B3B755A
MSVAEFALLVAAGIAGGLFGTIAGLASLATYPALLAVGLSPVSANVTNTVALVFTGVGSVLSSRPELAGQGPRVRRLAPMAVLGGVAGAVLLLSTPADGFERIVPWLIGFASLTILIPRRPVPDGHVAPDPGSGRNVAEAAGMALICVYGGYFGAAAGVLLLAMLLHTTHDTLPRANALKNGLLGCANGIAALIFAFLAPVNWAAVVPLGIGCLIGSWLGPKVVRWAPVTILRWLIGLAGLGLAVRLGVQAYG